MGLATEIRATRVWREAHTDTTRFKSIKQLDTHWLMENKTKDIFVSQ